MYAIEKPNRDYFDKVFCLVIAWMEQIYHDKEDEDKSVWIWEADEDTGKLVLLGPNDLCQQFHKQCGEIIANNPEIETWR